MPRPVSELIVNPVDQGTAEVSEKCSLVVMRLEAGKIRVGPERGLLYEVARVDRISRPDWYPPMRPAPQARQVTGKELIQSAAIAILGPTKQLLGACFGIRQASRGGVHDYEPPGGAVLCTAAHHNICLYNFGVAGVLPSRALSPAGLSRPRIVTP